MTTTWMKVILLGIWALLPFSTAEYRNDEAPESRSLLFERVCDAVRNGPANTDAFGTNKLRQLNCEQSVGTGRCQDAQNRLYDFCGIVLNDISLSDCQRSSERLSQVAGLTYDSDNMKCYAYWNNGATKAQLQAACPKADSTMDSREGSGVPVKGDGIAGNTCYKCTRL